MSEQSVFSGFRLDSLSSPKAIVSALEGIQVDKDRIMSEMEKKIDQSGIDPAVFAAFKAGDAAAKAQIDEALNGPGTTPAAATGGPFRQIDPNSQVGTDPDGRAISGGTDSPLVNPFKIANDIQSRAANVQKELDTTVNFAQQNRARVDQNQENEAAIIRDALAKKRALNDEDEAADADFKARVNPFLSKKAELDSRVAELATDGSIMTKIKGIFNSDFNEKKLRATSDKLAEAIQDMGFNYSVAADARAQDFASIDRRLKDDLTMGELETAHADEDLRANTIALQAAEQNFQFPGQMLGQQTQILVAQMAKRDEYLSNQDAATISDLLGKASKTGSVEIDGIPISKGALEEIAKRNEQLDLQMKSARLAYASNQIQHGDLVMRKAMQYMTVEQLNSAKANGGMYKGMKLPPEMIDAGIANGIQARLGAATAQVEMAGAPIALNQTAAAFAQNLRQVRTKLLSTFGGVPQALNPQMAAITQAGNQMSAALRAAKSPGEISALSAVWLPKIQALQAGFDKQVDSIANSMGEGDKVAAEFSRKFLRGEPMTAQDSFRFGKHFAEKGEMPSTIRSNPGGRAVTLAYAAAKKSVDDYITANGLKNIPDSQRTSMVEKEFKKQAPRIVARGAFDDLHSNLPQLAKRLNSPLGDIGTAAWARANAAGDSYAAEYMGKRLGLTPEQAQTIFAKGNDPRITPELKSKVAAARYAGLLESLDQIPGWKGSESPSDSLVNLLSSPQFLNRAAALDQARAGSSVGAAAADGVARGELSSLLGNYAKKLSTVNSERTATRVGGSFLGASRYANDGIYKARAVLGAIPGLNPAEEAQLVAAVRNQIRGEGAYGVVAQGVKEVAGLTASNSSNAAFGAREFEAVSSIITDGKFDNPRLERLRKIAAKDWRESSDSLDRAVDRLSKGDDE